MQKKILILILLCCFLSKSPGESFFNEDFLPHGDEKFFENWDIVDVSSDAPEFLSGSDGRLRVFCESLGQKVSFHTRDKWHRDEFTVELDIKHYTGQSMFELWLFRPLVDQMLHEDGYKFKWLQTESGLDYFMITKVIDGSESLIGTTYTPRGTDCLPFSAYNRVRVDVKIVDQSVAMDFYLTSKAEIELGGNDILRCSAQDDSGDYLLVNGIGIGFNGSGSQVFVDNIVASDSLPNDCKDSINNGYKYIGDLNEDCLVSLDDVVILVDQWLSFSDIGFSNLIFSEDYQDLLKWDIISQSNSSAYSINDMLEIVHTAGSSGQAWITLDTLEEYDFSNKNFLLSFDIKMESGSTQNIQMVVGSNGKVNTEQWASEHPSHAHQGYPESGYALSWYCDGNYSGVNLVHCSSEVILGGTGNISSSGLHFNGWYTFYLKMDKVIGGINFRVNIAEKGQPVKPEWSFSVFVPNESLYYEIDGAGVEIYARKYGAEATVALWIDNINVEAYEHLVFVDDFFSPTLQKWSTISKQDAFAISENESLEIIHTPVEGGQSWITLDICDEYDFDGKQYRLTFDAKMESGSPQNLQIATLPFSGVDTDAYAKAYSSYGYQGYLESGYALSWYCDGSYSGISLVYRPTNTILADSGNIYNDGLVFDKWYYFIFDISRDETGINFDIKVYDKNSGAIINNISSFVDINSQEYNELGKGLQIYSRKFGAGLGQTKAFLDNISVDISLLDDCNAAIRWGNLAVSDVVSDCAVDFLDFAQISSDWLECSDFTNFRINPIALNMDEFVLNTEISSCDLYLSTYAQVKIDDDLFSTLEVDSLDSTEFDYSSLSPGEHKVAISLLDSEGKQVNVAESTFNVIDREPIVHDLVNLNLSQVFEPVQVANNIITAARSQFNMSSGPFPTQIVLDGNNILADPISLMFDGTVITFEEAPVFGEQNDNYITFSSTASVNDRTFIVNGTLYYDGFIWYEVRIQGDEIGYGSLKLTAPLQISGDPIVNHSNLYPDKRFVHGQVNEIGMPTGISRSAYDSSELAYSKVVSRDKLVSQSYPLTCYLGLATDLDDNYCGLGLVNEGPVGWNLADYDEVYEIREQSSSILTLILNISDGITRWQTDQIEISFGIQPFPARTLDVEHNLNAHVNTSTLLQYYEKQVPGESFNYAHYWAEQGMQTALLFQEWTEYQNYWKTFLQDQWVTDAANALHAEGLDIWNYFGFEISNVIEEFDFNHTQVLKQPTNYPNKGFSRSSWATELNDETQRSWQVCYSSPWGDYFFRGVYNAIERYGLDGVYLDGTLYPEGCANTLHGCGVKDPYGRMIITFDILKKRKYAEILYNYENIIGRPLSIELHAPSPCPPVMSLIDSYLTGETAHLYDSLNRTDPEALRGMYNRKLYGIPAETYLRPPYKIEQTLAQSLLVDSFSYFNAGGSAEWTDAILKTWSIYDQYHLTSDSFVPFFSSANEVVWDNSDIQISYYDTGDSLVLIVSNYYNSVDQNVVIDLNNFDNITSLCTDVWNDVSYSFTSGQGNLVISSESMAILVFSEIK